MHIDTSADRSLPHPVRAVAAALAIAITIGTFSAVIVLFESLGLPWGGLPAAERACAELTHVSEREACMRQWWVVRHRVAHRWR